MTREEHFYFLIAEEASEVAQAAAKIARFGRRRRHPDELFNNQEALFVEFFHLLAVIEMAVEYGYVTNFRGGPGETAIISEKKAKVEKLMSLSRELGTLQD